MLREVKERVMSLGIGLVVSKVMIELVCKQGYDLSYGARPLRRAITRLIEGVLSEALLSENSKPFCLLTLNLSLTSILTSYNLVVGLLNLNLTI
ncbi:hypothetical protein Syun_022259 [Stephania yunnanensis]|uniref:Clp ATPase C-terminal domain-containing protein n=1 Tax=Stephania yunnanensis TaxID=152371 RepID=A0AAP0FCC0_9MAGN